MRDSMEVLRGVPADPALPRVRRGYLRIVERDVVRDTPALRELSERAVAAGARIAAVPAFLIGDHLVIGFDRHRRLPG